MKVKYVIVGACLVTLFLNACKKQSIEELPTTMCNIVEPIDAIPQYNHWSDTCPPNVHALACSLEYRLGTWVMVLDSIQAINRKPDTIRFITENLLSMSPGAGLGKDTTYFCEYYFQWSIWHLQNLYHVKDASGNVPWVQSNTQFDKDNEHFYYITNSNPVYEFRYKKLE